MNNRFSFFLIVLMCVVSSISAQDSLSHLALKTYDKQWTNIEAVLYQKDKQLAALINDYATNNETITNIYQEIADLYFFYKNDKKALIYYQKCLSLLALHKDNNSLSIAQILEKMAQIYERQKEISTAIFYYKKTQHTWQSLYTKSVKTPLVDSTKSNDLATNFTKKIALYRSQIIQGHLLFLEKKPQEAIQYFKQMASLISDERDIHTHPELSTYQLEQINTCYLKIAQIAEEQKDKKEALFYYNLCSKSSNQLKNDIDFIGADAYYGMAVLLQDLDKKLRYIQKSLAAVTLDYQNYSPLDNPEQIENMLDRAKALSCLNLKIFVLTSKWKTQAEDYRWLKLALKTCQLADQLIAQYRRDLSDNQSAKAAQLPYFLMTYEQGIEIAQILYRATGKTEYFDAAYFFSERNKAILLSEAKTVANAFASAEIPSTLLEKRDVLNRRIEKLQSEVKKHFEKGDSLVAMQLQNGLLFQDIRNSDVLDNELKNKYAYYLSKQYDTQVPSVMEVQKMLDDSTIIVEYSMNEVLDEYIYQSDHRRLYIYTISKNEVSITIAPWNIRLDKEIADFYKLLQKTSIIRKRKREQFIKLSHHLYRALVRPIEAYLPDSKRIIFVGEDQLNYVPFEVLIQDKNEQNFQNLSYLLKDFEISYHYSSTLLYGSFLQKNNHQTNGLLTFAPVFRDDNSDGMLASVGRAATDSIPPQTIRGGAFQPLLWTEQEATQIGQLFQANSSQEQQLLLETAANKTALKKQLQQPYQYIHLATHSFANLEHPDSSGVACYPIWPNAPKSSDNILYLNEIYPLDIQADLITLSSCESGLGKLQLGEGMLGLNRSFIYAGAPNVLFSLWKVNDKITSDFMLFFYESVFEGADYTSALRSAKLALLEQKGSALPVYWGAFQLIGRP